MTRRGALWPLAAALFLGCGHPEELPAARRPDPPALPGRLVSPDGTQAAVSADSAIVLYAWLPLPGYAPVEEDLRAIAGIPAGGDTAVFAVQLDADSRNSAQEQVNSLGIVLPVYLADSVLAGSIPVDQLPVAVLFGAGGTVLVETGTGSATRLLSR